MEFELKNIKQIAIIFSMLLILMIHFQPITLAQSPSFSIKTGVIINTGGPIQFTSDMTTTKLYFSGGLAYLDDFVMGNTFGDIGIQCPSGASMNLQSVATRELIARVTVPSGMKEFKFDTNKGTPAEVIGASSWSIAGSIVSAFSDRNADITIRWSTVSPPTGSGGGITPTAPEVPTLPPISGITITTWLIQYWRLLLIVGIVGSLIYYSYQKPSGKILRQKAFNNILPDFKDLEKAKDKFVKKLKKSVWT